MTQEHTPSPWVWNWRDDDYVTTSGSVVSVSHQGHAYAVAICPRYQSKEQWAADASLIAAAPDLLEALSCARKQLITLGGEANLTTDDDQIHAQVLFVIDCALAKATGENK